MKKIAFYIMVFTSIITGQKAMGQTEAEKEFDALWSLVKSNIFRIEITRVHPTAYFPDTHRFNPRGQIEFCDTVIKGDLPFFGRAYRTEYGKGAGMEFENKPENLELKIEKKKKYKSILLSFKIKSRNDCFVFTVNISPKGACEIVVNSNNRETVSYSGQVYKTENE